ncbi:MAG: hypothetical protein FWE10_05725 [Rikenellaceae bacterium]|nr:hypothetical protein [Rikenellaceae bacterium]MCL2693008.1 hypothetical protein [Rikenellaceae bacterium]
MKKLFVFLLAVVVSAGLPTGCGSSNNKVKLIVDDSSFSFVYSSSKKAVAYEKLSINGVEVYDTRVAPVTTTSISSFAMGVYFAFEEGQITVNDDVVSFNGALPLVYDSEWEYTLDDGVLNIITK